MATIRSLMVTETVGVKPEDSVATAADRMCQNRIGAVLIEDKGELLGLFSERDLLTRVVAAGLDPKTTPVGQVCTGTVATIEVDQPLRQVLELFRQRKFRHLPVLQNGKAVGILSTRDFLAWLVDGLERYIDESRYRAGLAEGIDPYDHLGGSYGR